ncbi:MAG TPA: DUF4142 domain-containing protein, partial [Sphingomicrobium sp.]|nr:DUF4142 domain-containing protein [Sphingomicrobium sp.]
MTHNIRLFGAASLIIAGAIAAPLLADNGPSDAEIAHIAYTAGQIDIDAARQALAKTRNAEVRSFASTMLRDHQAVNVKAL